MTGFRSAPLVLAGCLGLAAQKVEAPVLAYIWDAAAAELRPVWGSVGSATVGDPIETGLAVSAAAVSPRQDYILVLAGDGRAAVLFDPKTRAARPLAGVRAGASRIALSPDGSAAALCFDGLGSIQIIAGLPSTPGEPVEMHLAELAAPLRHLAVSDDGGLVLLVDASGEATAVSTAPGRAHTRIGVAKPINGIAFFPQSHDAVIAGEADVDAVRAAGGLVRLGGGLPGPSSLAVSRDGSAVVLAQADGKVRLFYPAGAATADLDCQCAPGEVAALNGRALFRLSNLSGDSALPLLDAESAKPKLSIVPPTLNSSK